VTSYELEEYAHTVAASTGVADLRKFGWIIERQYEGTTENGRKIHRYFVRGRTPDGSPSRARPSSERRI
jgi:hypothetical protein